MSAHIENCHKNIRYSVVVSAAGISDKWCIPRYVVFVLPLYVLSAHVCTYRSSPKNWARYYICYYLTGQNAFRNGSDIFPCKNVIWIMQLLSLWHRAWKQIVLEWTGSLVVISALAIQNVIPEWPLKSPLHINNFKGLLMPLFIIAVHMQMQLSWYAK